VFTFLRNRRFEVILFTFYALLAIVITWPLITKFSSSIYSLSEEYVLEANVPYSTPVRNADAYGTVWEMWWKKQAFLQKIPDDFCPLLGMDGAPTTAGLFHMPLVNTVGKWLTIFTNEVFAFNFLILLSFPLVGLAMYLLAYYLTKDKRAAVLAGFIFAFAPLHRRYSFEWLGMAQWHWLPLYVLALLKLDKTKTIKWGLLTGLLFSIVFIENYYFGYFLIFFTVSFVLFRAIQVWFTEKKFYFNRRFFQSCLLSLVTVVILTLPVTLTFVKESGRVATGEETELTGFVRDQWQRFALSARPWYYLLPDVNNPVLGGLTTRFYNWISKKPPYFLTQPFYPREHSLYLGWITLILSAMAVLWAVRRRTPPIPQPVGLKPRNPTGFPRRRSAAHVCLFLFLGIVMMIFSAPPYATINLHKIYFPSHYLYNLFPMFRSYARFGVLVLLCFSILAAFGAKFLLSVAARFYRAKKRQHKVLQLLVPSIYCLVPIFVFFEFLDIPPFHSVSLDPLPVYEWLADQPGDFAILVYPEDNSNFDLLAQRIHGKRFLNPKGRTPPEVREIYDTLASVETAEKLSDWGVKYVLIRRDTSLGLEANYTLIESYENPPVHLFEVR